MLNIEVQFCGLVLDLILIYFLHRHEHVGLRSEKLFRASLAINLTLIILDINSIFFIVFGDNLPAIVVDLACKIYLVSLLLASYMGFVYAYNDVKELRENQLFQLGARAFLIIGTIAVMASKIYYTHSDRDVYSYGPSAILTYVFAPVYIICSFFVTFLYRKKMNVHRKRAVRAWMFIVIVAAVVQFLFPKLLLVGFASSIGMLIMYAELENPEVYIDRTTGVFSFNCLMDYMVQLFDMHKRFACMGVCLSEEWHMSRDERKQVLLSIAEYLHGFSGTKLFRGLGNDFILVYEPDEDSDDYSIACKDDIGFVRQRFENPFEGWELQAKFIYLPDNRILENGRELMLLYQDYRMEIMDDRSHLFTIDREAIERERDFLRITREINEALEEDRIEVYLQPIYSVEDDRFVSAEALARMRDRNGEIVMPGIFIPVAEESGQIERLGEYVFERTCVYMEKENLRRLGIRYIEVNLSAVQCENEELSGRFRDILQNHGLRPDAVNLEITESSALTDRELFLENLDRLKSAGVSFSLDDFGTGESNLNYIVDMPVDIVKFDRSMVQDYFRSERAKVVMNATIRMIKELGLSVVAEGVETREQFDMMTAIGVDYIQGFYFSKPLPLEEFRTFVEKYNRKAEKPVDNRQFP
ncbi:MAG: EAL domain-containing protein [Lachnospiraceae bacterium]|nr:EAL domain-containing protein [Lachnospiraceae bacterium]